MKNGVECQGKEVPLITDESKHVMLTSLRERPHPTSSMMAIGLTQPALAFLILIGKQQTINP
jgi:hypothetical protein